MAFSAAACTSIGPVTVERDRFDYITAVAESWKEQTLLNIVRMRYGDAPGFVDVSSIIGAYAVQGQLAAGAAISSNLTNAAPWNLATLSGNATYLDRPTINWGQIRQEPAPADSTRCRLRVDSGRLPCRRHSANKQEPDPGFYPLLDA